MSWRHRARVVRDSLRTRGVAGTITLVGLAVRGPRSPFLDAHADLFDGPGLEIGGPSPLFEPRGYAPVYERITSLDNVNFLQHTRWQGDVVEGRTFRFRADAQPGNQFVHEATDLASIPSRRYRFLLACHVLEHLANPLKGLQEWRRVLAPGGTLLLVLPHKDATFDHRRPVTPLAHMVEDFEREVGEDDTTHLDEVLRLTDLRRDISQASPEAFRQWVAGNRVNRGVHHHVFDSSTAARLVDHAGLQLLGVEPALMESIFLFARNPADGEQADNAAFTSPDAEFLRRSPFASDRR